MKRHGVAALIALMFMVAAPAQADSLMSPASRDAAGNVTPGVGTDASAVTGVWTFKVEALSGRFSQVVVSIRDAAGAAIAFASNTKPRLGQTFQSFDPVPAGAYQLRAIIHGGSGPASITLSVDTP